MKLSRKPRLKNTKPIFYAPSAESPNAARKVSGDLAADSERLIAQVIADRIGEDQNGHKDEIDRLLGSMGLLYETQPPHRKFMQWVTRRNSYGDVHEEIDPAPRGAADLVSSETFDGNHAPVIDLDFPCRLYPSGTEGHFHLYLDKEISWSKFEGLLKAFVEAGLVEEQFYNMAKRRNAAFVRLPEKPKTEQERIEEQERKRKEAARKGHWSY